MAYLATFELRVKSYELDIYGHVNNAIYMNWFEHGRSQLLQDKGFNYTSIVAAWGVRLVTVAAQINFRAQLGLDDHVRVTSTVKRMGNSSVAYDQRILRVEKDGSETLACDCESTICFTDPEMKASAPIPAQFRELFGAGLG